MSNLLLMAASSGLVTSGLVAHYPFGAADGDRKRNLLRWSEDFSNAAWSKTDAATPSAQQIDLGAPSDGRVGQDCVDKPLGVDLTLAVELWAAAPTQARLYFYDNVSGNMISGDLSLTTEPQLFALTRQFNVASTARSIGIRNRSAGGAQTIYARRAQINVGTAPLQYEYTEANQILYDRSPYANHGQLGSTSGADVNDPYWTNQGARFAVDDFIRVAHSASMKPTAQLTVSAVVSKASWAAAPWEPIMSCTEAGGWILGANINSVNRVFVVHANGAYRSVEFDVSALSAGAHLFTGVFDGRYVRLRLDGQPAGTVVDLGATYPIHYAHNNCVMLGGEPDTACTPQGPYWNGDIMYVLEYQRATTLAEEARNYRVLRGILNRRGVVLP